MYVVLIAPADVILILVMVAVQLVGDVLVIVISGVTPTMYVQQITVV